MVLSFGLFGVGVEGIRLGGELSDDFTFNMCVPLGFGRLQYWFS